MPQQLPTSLTLDRTTSPSREVMPWMDSARPRRSTCDRAPDRAPVSLPWLVRPLVTHRAAFSSVGISVNFVLLLVALLMLSTRWWEKILLGASLLLIVVAYFAGRCVTGHLTLTERAALSDNFDVAVAVLDSLPDGMSTPSLEELENRARVVIAELSMSGSTRAGATRAALLAHAMCKNAAIIDRPTLQPPLVWMEEWRDGKRVPPQPLGQKQIDHLRSQRDLDLLVDEPGNRIRGLKATLPLISPPGRVKSGLWMFLHYCGRDFDLEAVRPVLRRGWRGTKDPGLRKYLSDARTKMVDLLGTEVVPESRDRNYAVPGDKWTWRWIRSYAEQKKSILLPPDYGNRA